MFHIAYIRYTIDCLSWLDDLIDVNEIFSIHRYTIDPCSRYKHPELTKVHDLTALKQLYDTDDPNPNQDLGPDAVIIKGCHPENPV